MLKIGDKIRDVEDGDCYYEGLVVHLEPLMYEITNVIWNGEQDTTENGKVTQPKWWMIKKEGN